MKQSPTLQASTLVAAVSLSTSSSGLLSHGTTRTRRDKSSEKRTTERQNLHLIVDCRGGSFLSCVCNCIIVVYFPCVQTDLSFVWSSGKGVSGCSGGAGTQSTGQNKE